MSSIIQYIKKLIADGSTEEAVKLVIELSNDTNNTTFINQALHLSSRLKKEQFNLRNGLSDGKIELNRISFSLLELCDELNNYLTSINSKPEIQESTNPHELSRAENFYEKFIGLQILNYTIMEYIHAGGFGVVYKAKHNKLGNIVALKISYAIEEGFAFLDEIMSVGITGLQLLNHQYIIKTIDIGEIMVDRSKRIFIVMEYISGGTLVDLNKENLKGEEVKKRITIFKQICTGLHYAHNLRYTNKLGFQSQGLMHGDIKPANVLLTDSFEPRIMDFMFVDMSKLIEIKLKLPKEIEELDSTTRAFGTDGYMPLEQKIHGIVTERTDIYGLGILLFEMLNPLKFSESQFADPSNRSTDELHAFLKQNGKKIPKYVSKIIYRATRDKEQDRYKSVQEIIDEIEKGDPWYQRLMG